MHAWIADNGEDTIIYIPGVPEIEPSDLMSYLQETDTSSVVHQIIFKAFEQAKAADYVICNTVQELEPETILALNANQPFYAIGPIFVPSVRNSTSPSTAIATSLWTEFNCKQWLDSKPRASILYMSFGSYAHLSKRDLEEIACGVLKSEVGCIWVLRPDIVSSDEVEPLPKGFMDESKERGMVVPWYCQTEVLAHDSVGEHL
ncbi:putative 7-deoxyloganetin glucosyltransferase [Dioscorea sansibarensis]